MSWQEFINVMSLPFAERALLTVIVLAVGSGIVGVFVSLRNMEFMTDGIVHTIFPGLAAGYLMAGSAGVFTGALIAALIAAAIITLLQKKPYLQTDTTIAVTLSAAFSLGIVLVSKQRSYISALENLLFGSLLTVTAEHLLALTVTVLVAVTIVLVTWHRQLYLAFDPVSFAASGYSKTAADATLSAAIAMVTVAGTQALGNLMVIALIIAPVSAARQLTGRLALIAPVAILIAVLAGLAGLSASVFGSYALDANISAGSAIVLFLVLSYLTAALIKKLAKPRPPISRTGVS